MSKSIKVPKKVAGVKVPKALRKGALNDFLNSSAGKLLIAEAIAAAVAALALRRTESGERTATVVGRRAMELGETARDEARRASDRLSTAVRAGVQAFREALQDEYVDTGAEPVVAGNQDEEDSPTKKRGASGVKSGAATH